MCRKAPRIFKLRQCSRCQAYDHTQYRCSATMRCGICAGQHLTKFCRSTFLQCAVCNGAHASYQRICHTRQAEQKELDDDQNLHDLFYRTTEDLEPEMKMEAPPDNSSAIRPPSFANTGAMRGSRAQERPTSYPSLLRTEQNQSLQTPPLPEVNDLDPNHAHMDPKAILEQLEHLKAVVAELLPPATAGTTRASTSKRRALDHLSGNAVNLRSAGKRVMIEDSSVLSNSLYS